MSTSSIDWVSEAAARFGAAVPVVKLHENVRAFLAELSASERVCVAFSGGADSLALLLSLCAHFPERVSQISALHFNHGLRGAAADGDEAFCREVCRALKVDFSSGRSAWAEGAAVSEAEAREARQGFFFAEMDRRGARVLLVGQQRDDVVENILLRLARGGGLPGLAGPRPVQRLENGRVALRPLLDLSRAEIEQALRTVGATWREDASNATDVFTRNRLRRHVVPAWRGAAAGEGDLDAAVAASRTLLEEADEALETWAGKHAGDFSRAQTDVRAWRDLPRAVVRRLLHRWFSAQGFEESPRRVAFEAALDAVYCDGVVSIGEGEELVVESAVLRLARRAAVFEWSEAIVPLCGAVFFPDGSRLVSAILEERGAALVARARAASDPVASVVIGFSRELPALYVRRWRSGDRYRPLGWKEDTKLQNQFVNRKIPSELRARLPVVTEPGGEIFWVPNLPPSEKGRVSEETILALQLTYESADSLSTAHV